MPRKRSAKLPQRAKRSSMHDRRRPPHSDVETTHDAPIETPLAADTLTPHARPNLTPRQRPNAER